VKVCNFVNVRYYLCNYIKFKWILCHHIVVCPWVVVGDMDIL